MVVSLLCFVPKGAKFSATVSGNEAEVKFNAMYFELPIGGQRFNVANEYCKRRPYLAGVGGNQEPNEYGGSKTDIKEKLGNDALIVLMPVWEVGVGKPSSVGLL